jgi:hypothetical protein
MDELSHWMWTLTAVGLWLLAVGLVYFFFLRGQMKNFDNITTTERAMLFKTRRQILLDPKNKNKKD